MPTHGEYQPGKGFYDKSLNGWIRDPAKLTQRIQSRELTASDREQVEGWGNHGFKADPEMESLIRLRDSKNPEDRANFNKIATGGRRINLATYEEQKAAAD